MQECLEEVQSKVDALQAKISQLKQHSEMLSSPDEFAETYQRINDIDDVVDQVYYISPEWEQEKLALLENLEKAEKDRDQKSQEIEHLKD